jgi:hypothetical protein
LQIHVLSNSAAYGLPDPIIPVSSSYVSRRHAQPKLGGKNTRRLVVVRSSDFVHTLTVRSSSVPDCQDGDDGT